MQEARKHPKARTWQKQGGMGTSEKGGERVHQLLEKVSNVIEFRVTRKRIIGTTFHICQSWNFHIMHNIQSSIKQVPFTQALSPTAPPTGNILVQWKRKSRTHRYPALPLWPNQSALPHLKWVMPQLV